MTLYVDGIGEHYYEPLPKLNRDLLEEAVAWAQYTADHEWDRNELGNTMWGQGSWSTIENATEAETEHECQTSYCLAGYAVMASGLLTRTRVADEGSKWWKQYFTHLDQVPGLAERLEERGWDVDEIADAMEPDALVDASERESLWSVLGEVRLGLTSTEAHRLFSGANTINTVRYLADEICLSRGQFPLDLSHWSFQLNTTVLIDTKTVEEGKMVRKDVSDISVVSAEQQEELLHR